MTVMPPRPRCGEGRSRGVEPAAASKGALPRILRIRGAGAPSARRQPSPHPAVYYSYVRTRRWGPGVSPPPPSAARAVQPAGAVAAGGSKQDS